MFHGLDATIIVTYGLLTFWVLGALLTISIMITGSKEDDEMLGEHQYDKA